MKQIVYIEDEQEMIDLVHLILSRKGYEVVGVRSARESLNIMHHLKPDLVLLDLMMPDLDGWEIYQQIKADVELSNVPVIVITAKAQGVDRIFGLEVAKVDDFITKPFSPEKLVDSVRNVFSKQQKIQEALN